MRHLALLPLLLVTPAIAQDAAVAEVRAAWAACSERLETGPAWTGWHQDFGNGYAHDFEFVDGSWDATPSVLKEVFVIDGIAVEEQTSCFRPDGSVAFVFTVMSSPNMAGENGEGPTIAREGRIYIDPAGEVVRVLTQIIREGEKVADTDNEQFMLARGCGALDLHRDVASVLTHRDSVLADIEGKRPVYEPNMFDWCAVAEPQ